MTTMDTNLKLCQLEGIRDDLSMWEQDYHNGRFSVTSKDDRNTMMSTLEDIKDDILRILETFEG